MSDPIKVGDLVMVVKCCCHKYVRTPVFVVRNVIAYQPAILGVCKFCHKMTPVEPQALDLGVGIYGYPISWLKKIPPLDDLKQVDETTNLDEPAHV